MSTILSNGHLSLHLPYHQNIKKDDHGDEVELNQDKHANEENDDDDDDELDTSGTWQEVESVNGEEFSDHEDFSTNPHIYGENIDPRINQMMPKPTRIFSHNTNITSCSSNNNNTTTPSIKPLSSSTFIVSPTLTHKVLSSPDPDGIIHFNESTQLPSKLANITPSKVMLTTGSSSPVKPSTIYSRATTNSTDSLSSMAISDKHSDFNGLNTENGIKMNDHDSNVDFYKRSMELEELNKPNQKYLKGFISFTFYIAMSIVLVTAIYATFVYVKAWNQDQVQGHNPHEIIVKDPIIKSENNEATCTPFYSLISFTKLPDSISKSFLSMKKCS